MAASSTRGARRTGWASLPPELRQPIIKMACIEAQGGPEESGSCAKLASTRLNLVDREFEAIVSPVQWQHLELDNTKDVGFFVAVLVPKYAGTWRKFTLKWDESERNYVSPQRLRGLRQAKQVVGVSQSLLFACSAREPMHAVLRQAMSYATALKALALFGTDWLELNQAHLPLLPTECCVRKLHLQLPQAVTRMDTKNLSAFLLLLRQSLEELRLELHNFSCRGTGDLFEVWREHNRLEPPLPHLKILATPESLGLPALRHQRLISKHLEVLDISPDFLGLGWTTSTFGGVIEKYAATLRAFALTERDWRNWRWTSIRSRFQTFDNATRQACERHGIQFRWAVVRAQQLPADPEGTECPADLAEWVKLV